MLKYRIQIVCFIVLVAFQSISLADLRLRQQRKDPVYTYPESVPRRILEDEKKQREKEEKERKIRENRREMDRIANERDELKRRFDAIDVKVALKRAEADIVSCTNAFSGCWTQEAINHTNLVFQLVRVYRAAYRDAANCGANTIVGVYRSAVEKLEKSHNELRNEIDSFSFKITQMKNDKEFAEQEAAERREREERLQREREEEAAREKERKAEEQRFEEERRKKQEEESKRLRIEYEKQRQFEAEEAERVRQHELEMHKKQSEMAAKSVRNAVLLICGMVIAVVAIKLIIDRI